MRKPYVETTIVVDPVSFRFHGGEVEKMAKTILNVVSKLYILNTRLNARRSFETMNS